MKHVTIKSYEQASNYLGSKQDRPYAHNTRIERNNGAIVAKYHGNTVATFNPDSVSFSSCGWKTTTTKERINWFLPEGFYLYQEKSVWYLSKHMDRSHVWQDGITVHNDGSVTGAAAEDTTKQTIKAIKKYVDGYIKALLSGDVPAPSSGDCWYCLMKTQDGESLGDATHNTDHILGHFEESYYVPSLLTTAYEFNKRLSTFARDGVARLWQGETISEWQQDIVTRDVKSCMTAYLKHVLGVAQ